MSTDRARESAFNRAVEFCYDMDGDPDRNSIRYFSPPEDYVEVAFDCLLDEVVQWLRHVDRLSEIPGASSSMPVHNPLWDAANALEAEFGVPQPEQPA